MSGIQNIASRWRLILMMVGLAAMGLLLTGCWSFSGFLVVSTADAVDAAPGDGVCATEAGECTLRAAIQEANERPGMDEIRLLPDWTYRLDLAGRSEDAAATGDLDITEAVRITGVGATIDAAGLDRIFDIRPGVGRVVIQNVTITGGDPDDEGGGISNTGALTLRDITVEGNEAAGGGGIASYGELAVINSTVSGNVSSNVGGALYALGGTTSLDTTTVSGNTSNALGAVHIEGGEATLHHTTVTANTGGGWVSTASTTRSPTPLSPTNSRGWTAN